MIEVGVCLSSGFAIVHQPTGSGPWEIQYLLDATGNQEATALMETVPPGAERNAPVGFVVSASGTVDSSGARPILRIDSGSMSSPSASGTTTAPIPTPPPVIRAFNESSFSTCATVLTALRFCWSLTNTTFSCGIRGPPNAGYVAFGITDQNGGTMREADMFVAVNDPFARETKAYYSTGFSMPVPKAVQPSLRDAFLTPSQELVMTFTRPIAADGSSQSRAVPMSEEMELIFAYSPSGRSFGYHGTFRTAVRINSRTGATISSPSIPALVVAHAALMGLAWALCAGVGVFAAAFIPKSKSWWFWLHVVALGVTALLTFIAFGLIVAQVENSTQLHFLRPNSPTSGAHAVIGIIIVTLVCLQIILGIIIDRIWRSKNRRSGDIPETTLLDQVHWWSGRMLSVLAFVNLFLGAAEINAVAAYVIFAIVVAAWLVLYLVFCLRKQKSN